MASRHLSLQELQRIKRWHIAHKRDHPIEYQILDLVLMLWIMGWVGWLPAFAFEAAWAFPLCAFAMMLPHLYVRWRIQAHGARRLRCDWLGVTS